MEHYQRFWSVHLDRGTGPMPPAQGRRTVPRPRTDAELVRTSRDSGIDDWPAVLGRWRTGSSGAVAQLQRGQVFGQADRPPCGARPAQPRHATRLAMTICSALVAR